MSRGAWESVHGDSRKWFPEQHRRSRWLGIGRERPPPHQLTPRYESELGPGGGLLESRPDLPSGQTAPPCRIGIAGQSRCSACGHAQITRLWRLADVTPGLSSPPRSLSCPLRQREGDYPEIRTDEEGLPVGIQAHLLDNDGGRWVEGVADRRGEHHGPGVTSQYPEADSVKTLTVKRQTDYCGATRDEEAACVASTPAAAG